MKIHLKDRSAPLAIEADFSGESAELLTAAQSASPRVKKILSGLAVRGPVSGTIRISGSRRKPLVSLKLVPKGVFLTYSRLPWPLKIAQGTFSLRGKALGLSGVGVSGPPGDLRLSLRFDFSKKPYRLKLTEARGKLFFQPLKPLLLRFPEVRRFLKEYDLSLETVEISSLSYRGPVSGRALRERLYLEARISKGRIFLSGGLGLPLAFQGLPLVYQPGKFGFGPGTFETRDSVFSLSGVKDLKTGAFSFRGTGRVSPELLAYFYERFGWPERFRLRAPLRVKNLDLSLTPDENLRLSLSLVSPKGASLEAEVERGKTLLRVRGGHLLYRGQTLHFAFERFPEEYRISLKGELSPQVLSAIFEENPGLEGYFKADFEADFNLARPLLSRFRGRLEGRDLTLPVKGTPQIKRFRLRGAGRTFHFEELVASLAGSDFVASGRLEVVPKNFRLEGALRSRLIDLPALKSQFFQKKSLSSGKKFKVVGHLAVKCQKLRLTEKRSLENFQGEVFLYPKGGRVVISEARFCSLPLQGDYRFGEHRILNLNLYEPSGDFTALWACLSPRKEVLISGPFSLRADFHLGGKKDLFEEGRGTFRLESPSGEIHRFGLLAKIFGFLSPIDLFKGQLPSLEEEGFPYRGLSVVGKLSGRKFHVEQARLEGPGLRLFASGDVFLPEGRLDLTVLASPFKTVDAMVSRIPVVGFVLTGKKKMLVSFPIGVRGSYRDPTIIPLDPKAIGQGVFGLFKRVFELPAQIVAPKD